MSLWKYLQNWNAKLRLSKIRRAFSVSCLDCQLLFHQFCFLLRVISVYLFILLYFLVEHPLCWWCAFLFLCLLIFFSTQNKVWLVKENLCKTYKSIRSLYLSLFTWMNYFFFFLSFHLCRWFEVCCWRAWTGEKPTTGADFGPRETMWRSRGPSATTGSHWITTGTQKLFGLYVLRHYRYKCQQLHCLPTDLLLSLLSRLLLL